MITSCAVFETGMHGKALPKVQAGHIQTATATRSLVMGAHHARQPHHLQEETSRHSPAVQTRAALQRHRRGATQL
jgi:hypothetical protein